MEWDRDAKEAVKIRLLLLEFRLLTVQTCGNRKVAKKTNEIREQGPPWPNSGVHHGPWPPPWIDRGGYWFGWRSVVHSATSHGSSMTMVLAINFTHIIPFYY